MDLVVLIYEITKSFPKEEIYGLTSQMRRAAISVPSNISEGAAGRSPEQFKNYLGIALGSLNELQTQVEIAKRLDYFDEANYVHIKQVVDECTGLVYGLKKSIS